MTARVSYIALAPLAIFAGMALAEQEPAGDVSYKKFAAYAYAADGQRRTLKVREKVYPLETLETVALGALHVLLKDKTVLRMGASSKLTIDSYVYDPLNETDSLVATFTEGIFRYLSGKMRKKEVELKTPVSTIGVRGTDLIIAVEANGTTLVEVNEGSASITPTGGAAIPLEVRDSIRVYRNGRVEFGVSIRDDSGIGNLEAGGGGEGSPGAGPGAGPSPGGGGGGSGSE